MIQPRLLRRLVTSPLLHSRFPSRISSAVLVAARHTLHRPFAVLKVWSVVQTDPPCSSPPHHAPSWRLTPFILIAAVCSRLVGASHSPFDNSHVLDMSVKKLSRPITFVNMSLAFFTVDAILVTTLFAATGTRRCSHHLRRLGNDLALVLSGAPP